MKLRFLLSLALLLNWGTVAIAEPNSPTDADRNHPPSASNPTPPFTRLQQVELHPLLAPLSTTSDSQPEQPSSSSSDILHLSEISSFSTSAELLTQQLPSREVSPSEKNQANEEAPNSSTDERNPPATDDAEIQIDITGTRLNFPPTSTPVYEITEEEIEKQSPNSLAEVLRGLPGFAINDVGFGADIHTGTYYRGNSINQSVFLLNGRRINTNINTYHGATDLNSSPVGSVERVELSSGTSSTLYGSEAFGGVVNIITKEGTEIPRFNGLVEYGSFDQSNYRASYGGSAGSLKFNFGYEQYEADNRYRVPKGAANRDSEGRLFNGDTDTSN